MTINDARLLQERLAIIDLEGTAKRLNISRQIPTFWERQLRDLEKSNSFSMSTLVNQFSGAMASWIVQGTSFKNFWVSLQMTMVQALLNMIPQLVASWISGELARAAATQATNGTIVASNAAAAAASGASWSASLQIVWGEIVLLGTAGMSIRHVMATKVIAVLFTMPPSESFSIQIPSPSHI